MSLGRFFCAAFLCLSPAVYNCAKKDEKPPPPRAARKKVAVKKKAVEAPPPVVAEDFEIEEQRGTYGYSPVGKRDPFRSPFLRELETHTEEGEVITPLQRFDLDQLKLVGVVWGIPNPVAMVEDPEGNGYVIEKGTLIGKNWGKVARIIPEEVVVTEEYRDWEGKLIANEISMRLRAEGEEE